MVGYYASTASSTTASGSAGGNNVKFSVDGHTGDIYSLGGIELGMSIGAEAATGPGSGGGTFSVDSSGNITASGNDIKLCY